MKKVVIEPVTRVEGHGKVTIHLDERRPGDEARLHIVEFRGFERFIRGRLMWEVPVIVQRLCGICPVSHHLAAAKAMDRIVGGDTLPPTAEKMRRLMHYGQIMQSHVLHFFHLSRRISCSASTASPGYQKRNVFEVLRKTPSLPAARS
jgi:NAD-reducing hydrogenase large subunit